MIFVIMSIGMLTMIVKLKIAIKSPNLAGPSSLAMVEVNRRPTSPEMVFPANKILLYLTNFVNINAY